MQITQAVHKNLPHVLCNDTIQYITVYKIQTRTEQSIHQALDSFTRSLSYFIFNNSHVYIQQNQAQAQPSFEIPQKTTPIYIDVQVMAKSMFLRARTTKTKRLSLELSSSTTLLAARSCSRCCNGGSRRRSRRALSSDSNSAGGRSGLSSSRGSNSHGG